MINRRHSDRTVDCHISRLLKSVASLSEGQQTWISKFPQIKSLSYFERMSARNATKKKSWIKSLLYFRGWYTTAQTLQTLPKNNCSSTGVWTCGQKPTFKTVIKGSSKLLLPPSQLNFRQQENLKFSTTTRKCNEKFAQNTNLKSRVTNKWYCFGGALFSKTSELFGGAFLCWHTTTLKWNDGLTIRNFPKILIWNKE